MNLSGLLPLAPEIAAIVAASAILLLFAFWRRGGATPRLLLAGIATAGIGVLLVALPDSGSGRTLANGMLRADLWALFFRCIAVVALVFTLFFSYPSREISRGTHLEFVGLLLLSYAAIGLLVMARNLILMYLSLEMLSIASYLCVSFNREAPRSSEAGVKYAVFGAVASALTIFGISWLYGLTGTFDYDGIRQAVLASDARGAAVSLAFLVTAAFLLSGFLFKIAAVPLHGWAPDAYEGGPTPFVAFLSVASKAAGFAALIRLLVSVFLTGTGTGEWAARIPVDFRVLLGVVAALTMSLGNLAAINQKNTKRMLAYSSIAHTGYLLMGLATLSASGFTAVAFYFVAYLLMDLGAFFGVHLVAGRKGSEDVETFAGLGSSNPWLAACLTVSLLSLTGLPPSVGFIGKVYLFAAVIREGGFWYIALAIVGILNSVVSLYYYLRIVRSMYLEESQPSAASPVPRMQLGVLAVLAALVILGGVYWSPIAALASAAVLQP